MLRHGSLFSGIGGFDLAAEWCGWENIFHCEWNEFGQRVLKHYWPKADSFGDITKTDFTKYNGTIDIISGGFPCQPYSSAGKRLGKEDERHLWPEMLRVIREVQPRYVVGENVYGLLNWNGGLVFDEVHADLAAEGYETQAVVIPAAAVNAPHGRDRIWFVAKNTSGIGLHNGKNETRRWRDREFKSTSSFGKISETFGDVTNADTSRLYKQHISTESKKPLSCGGSSYERGNFSRFPTEPPVCGGDDGLPTKLDGITFSKWRNESIKAYGNAIVPQVAYQIFKTIEQTIK